MMRTLMTKTTSQKKTQTTCPKQTPPHRPARLMAVVRRRATRVTSKLTQCTMQRQVVMVQVLVMSLPMVWEQPKRRMAQL